MIKKIKIPIVIFAVGVILIAGSGAGATRAVLNQFSNQQYMQINTSCVKVDLEEEQNGNFENVEAEDALKFTSVDRENFHIGYTYPEKVRVHNTSWNERDQKWHDEYVRVTVKKSWTNKDNKKNTLLDPALINLGIEDGWIENKNESTPERSVYYLARPLKGDECADFIKSVTINDKVLEEVHLKDYVENGTKIDGTIVNEYDYDGKSFYVEVKVDAIQTHHPEEAILAAWGVDVELDGNSNIIEIK